MNKQLIRAICVLSLTLVSLNINTVSAEKTPSVVLSRSVIKHKRPAKMEPIYRVDKNLTISGPAIVSKEQAVMFVKANSPKAKLTCSIEEIVNYYYSEAHKEGIRPDLALAQALVETGFFNYGGTVKYNQNNFCGLGTTSRSVKGAAFRNAEIGVRAHIQHLLVYSSRKVPSEKIVDPRFDLVRKTPRLYATSKKWTDLDGRWAMSVDYGNKILMVHAKMLQYGNLKPGSDMKNSKNKSLQDRIEDIFKGVK